MEVADAAPTTPAPGPAQAWRTGDLVALVEAVLTAARDRDGGAPSLFTQGARQVDGASFARDVDAVVAALARRGLGPGDVVLFGVRPGIDALVLVLACLRLGACLTFVDPGAGDDLFRRRIALQRPGWVMAETLLYVASARTPVARHLRRAGLALPRLASLPARHLRVGRRIPGLVPPSLALHRLAREPVTDEAMVAAPPTVDPDAPALVVFTSGTTGDPKGVVHTGRSVTGAVATILDGFDLPADAVVYTHNIHTFVVAALRGASCVVAPLSIGPERFLADVEAHGVTHAFLLPVEAWEVALHLERSGGRMPGCLQHLFLFSAPITTTVLERVHATAGPDLAITCAYAMTEMIPVAWIDSREKLAWAASDGDGDVVGRPGPGVEVRVVDDELELRGPSRFGGYLGHGPVDWHRTGDLARIDDAGRVVLMGRAKDMVIRGDFNLYPGLYEPTVASIEGVAACAIVGVPDPQTADERVVLYIEPDGVVSSSSDGARELHALRERVERGLRTGPSSIDVKALPDLVVVVPALPRSGRSRKVDRLALRRWAAADPRTGAPPRGRGRR